MISNQNFFHNTKILPVDKFFENVLFDKKIGYYSSKSPFGNKGDFITSPGVSNLFSEFFREPDSQVGYLFNLISMGTMLSIFMMLAGIIIFFKKNDI